MPPALRDPGTRAPGYTGAPPVVMPQQGQPPAPNPFTKPAAGGSAPGGPPKLTPHQMYQQWVAAGRHGASGANILAPPPAPPGSPAPPSAPPPGSAPAPGSAPPGSSPSPSGPGGPGAGSGLTPNGNPFVGSQTAPGGFNPFAPFMGRGGGGSGGPGGMPHTYAYNDPFNQALALLPTMDENAKRQISGAMSSAGLSGNRFGSYAQNVAGQIGGETALQENQSVLSAMQQQALAEQGQALTANATGVGAGSAMESAMQQNLMNPFAIGQYEQGRQDQFSNLRYQDFNQNKLGWFPYLLQGAISRQAGYPGPVMYNTTGSQPGGLDWASALLPGLVGLSGAGGIGNVLSGLFGGNQTGSPGLGTTGGQGTGPGPGIDPNSPGFGG